MGFRSGKYKNKFIAFLLVLSIIVQQFVCPALIRATELDNGFYATYWDLFNSIASEMGYSMSEIKEDHNVSRPDVMDRANVSFLKFMDWLGQTPSINHSGGGHDIEDDSSGDHSGGGTSIREDTEVYIEEAKNLMRNATTKGIKMSQGLWDAFHDFFDSVESKKKVDSESSFYNLSDLSNYVSGLIGKKVNFKDSCYNVFLNKNIYVYAGYVGNNVYHYLLYCPKKTDVRHVTQDDNVITGYGGKYGGFVDSNNQLVSCYLTVINVDGGIISFYDDAGVSFYDKFVLLGKKWIIQKDFNEVYSPYINYTPIGTAPAQVPDIIPWSTFPDHEVTDDDTKIYIPVESPEEETPTETPEEPTETPEPPTETPEEPTETPGDSNDGDDITNLVPIFPDIDIDPDIHLPDDWINPPGIDLDPDVDVDTPSPGGKIPHLQKLKEKFPFCIPFDLVLLFKMLNKKPKAPKWEFKHDFQIGDSKPYTWEVVVDMSDYDKYVQIFREGFFLLFLVGLFFVTKKLISWQTG